MAAMVENYVGASFTASVDISIATGMILANRQAHKANHSIPLYVLKENIEASRYKTTAIDTWTDTPNAMSKAQRLLINHVGNSLQDSIYALVYHDENDASWRRIKIDLHKSQDTPSNRMDTANVFTDTEYVFTTDLQNAKVESRHHVKLQRSLLLQDLIDYIARAVATVNASHPCTPPDMWCATMTLLE